MIEIVNNKIDTQAVLESVIAPECGANLLFVGTTRQFTGERETAKLDYECYNEMAIKKMNELSDEARSKWPIEKCSIVHRIGEVEIGVASIAVAVSSPHRGDCFAAGQWLIDTLKKQVPIWKKEQWVDGSVEWVHPDGATPAPNRADVNPVEME